MRILCFGDSTTQGFNDPLGGWVSRLWQHYSKSSFEPTVFNLGISGDTSTGLGKRIKNEISAREFSGEQIYIVCAIGVNDTVYRSDNYEATEAEFRENLHHILKEVNNVASGIIFISLAPVTDSKLQPMPWSTSGKCYSAARILKFNKVLEDVVRENDLPLVDIWSEFEGRTEELTDDGIHPNEAGHALIFELVKNKLKEVLRG